MQATDYTRSRSDRGPEIYYGYCGRTRRYRMMDLPDYMSNMQQGFTRMMSDPAGMYQEIARGYSTPGATRPAGVRTRTDHDSDCGCGCHDRRGDWTQQRGGKSASRLIWPSSFAALRTRITHGSIVVGWADAVLSAGAGAAARGS